MDAVFQSLLDSQPIGLVRNVETFPMIIRLEIKKKNSIRKPKQGIHFPFLKKIMVAYRGRDKSCLPVNVI